MLNRVAWRDGIVAPDRRRRGVLDSVERALRRGARRRTATPIVVRTWRANAPGADSLGLGGPAGGDVYFDLAPRLLLERRGVRRPMTALARDARGRSRLPEHESRNAHGAVRRGAMACAPIASARRGTPMPRWSRRTGWGFRIRRTRRGGRRLGELIGAVGRAERPNGRTAGGRDAMSRGRGAWRRGIRGREAPCAARRPRARRRTSGERSDSTA